MADTASLQDRLKSLTSLRAELGEIEKEAFMAAPPMPADPAAAGGMMPPGGMPPGAPAGGAPPVDPATGMPIDPNTGMPMDPSMMGGGMPPGAAPPMDPAMAGGAPPPGGELLSPEMLDEMLGVLEELAAANDAQEQKIAQLEQAVQECMAKCDEMEQRMAQADAAAAAQPAVPGGWE